MQKMSAASYQERVPENVRKQDSEKVEGYEKELATLQEQQQTFAKFQ